MDYHITNIVDSYYHPVEVRGRLPYSNQIIIITIINYNNIHIVT